MQNSELSAEALQRLARFVDRRGGPGAPGVDLPALVAVARRRAGLRWRKIEEKEALREYRRGRALLAAEGEEGEGLPSPEAQAQAEAVRRWRDLQGRPRELSSSPVFSLSSPRARASLARDTLLLLAAAEKETDLLSRIAPDFSPRALRQIRLAAEAALAEAEAALADPTSNCVAG